MLTKQDKNYFIKNFSTKKDLEIFATKEDLKVFSTKQQLDQQALDIGTEFERVREEAHLFRAEVNGRFDKIESKIDNISTKLDKTLDRWQKQDQLNDKQERRLLQLEADSFAF